MSESPDKAVEKTVEKTVDSDDKQPRDRTESESSNPDIHFEPVIQLPLVDIQ
ncbi:unnamed protein product, partial [Oppiella nova]